MSADNRSHRPCFGRAAGKFGLIAALAGVGPATSATQAAGLQPLDRDEMAAVLSARNASFVREDFEKSMARFLPPMEFAACTEPVSSRSDDACFAPGDLAEGFSISSSNRYGVLSLGRDIIGFPSMTVGAWPYRISPSSLNFTQVVFDAAPTLVAADVYGFRLANGSATGETAPVTVEAFDRDGGSLGSFVVSPASVGEPAFAGFSSAVPIGRVEFGARDEGAGAQIDNLLFGGLPQLPSASHQRLGFGASALGGMHLKSVDIINHGDQPWQLDAPSVNGDGYSMADEDCSQEPLAAQSSCTIWVAFEPTYVDSFFGRVEVTGDFGESALAVQLHGLGVVQEGGQ